ncbi:MAG: zinc-dependent alcohol dehydrogenase family protein [Alphaproteobacteria bacterium]
MRAYEICSAAGIDTLHLAERDTPRPGPGQVLVRMRANSINYRDLMTILDPQARGFAYPRIPNSDGAGDVVEVGEGVTRFKAGDRVVGMFFQNWTAGGITAEVMASALGGPIDGVLCDHAVLEEDGVVAIPAHLSYEEAATLPCAGLTAWHIVVGLGQVRAGDTVLILGTGGVSIFALQFARLHGARAIVTSSSDEKLARAVKLGAWQTINYRTEANWEKRVLELTDGRGVDLVAEVGGPGTLEKSIQAVRVGGAIGLVGVLTGGKIDPTGVMRKSLRLQGIYVGNKAMFEDMARALTAHETRPVIDSRVAFEDAPAAYHRMRGAGHFGKVVINI